MTSVAAAMSESSIFLRKVIGTAILSNYILLPRYTLPRQVSRHVESRILSALLLPLRDQRLRVLLRCRSGGRHEHTRVSVSVGGSLSMPCRFQVRPASLLHRVHRPPHHSRSC